MANTKSALKRIKQDERNRQRNQAVRTRVKTYMKKALDAIQANDQEKVKDVLPKALSEIDKAACKGIIHRNNASRKKSQLQQKARKLEA